MTPTRIKPGEVRQAQRFVADDGRFGNLAPVRSLEQRMAALGTANRIRSSRAVLKREIKAGRASLVDVLLDPPEVLDSMKVVDLMLAAPKFGRVKVNKILNRARVSPSKTVGGLSQRQRTEIVSLVRR